MTPTHQQIARWWSTFSPRVRPARRRADILRVLIKAGADVRAKDKKGRTALMHAATGYGPAETIHALLDAGADPRAKDDKDRTALDLMRDSNNAGAKERAEILERALKRQPEK